MLVRKRQKMLPLLALALGLLGLVLRLVLIGFLRDQRGLLPAAHPVGVMLFLAAACALALALYAVRCLEDAEDYQQSFPASLPGCLGHIFAAVGILVTAITVRPDIQGALPWIWRLLAFISVPCLGAAGWLRYRGKQPFFLLHLCPGLFLMLHAISNYQIWSKEPQLTNYFFSLSGVLCMMFYVLYRSGMDADLAWRRKLTFAAYLAVSLGLMALPGCKYIWLYLGCALWALLDRPVMVPRRRRPRPFEEEMT